MADRNKKGNLKNYRVDLEQEYEMQYWTSQLKITNDQLREAVAAVGNSVEAIKVYLNKA